MTMIKIDFTKTDGVNTLKDAIYLPEGHTMSEADIEAMKQERFDNWIAVITAPPAEEPAVEQVVEGV